MDGSVLYIALCFEGGAAVGDGHPSHACNRTSRRTLILMGYFLPSENHLVLLLYLKWLLFTFSFLGAR